MWRRAVVVTLVMWAVVVATSELASATERLTRRFTSDDGLPVTSPGIFAEDANGVLWIGSEAGLARYNGRRIEGWAPETLNERVSYVATGPRGEVVALARAAWQVSGRGLAPLLGPDGAQLRGVGYVAFGPDGAMWIVQDGVLQRRTAGGAWQPPFALPERARAVAVRSDGDAYVTAGALLWRVGADGSAERLVDTGRSGDLILLDDDTVALARGTKLMLWHGGALEVLADRPGWAVWVARRGERLWLSWDYFFGYKDPGEPPRIWRVPSAGQLVVDREGSLWMGTGGGLVQFPEPDTEAFGQSEGLDVTGAIALARGPEGIFFNSWAEPGYILDPDTRALTPIEPQRGAMLSARICTDATGSVWTSHRNVLSQRRDGTWIHHPLAAGDGLILCSVAPDGSVWAPTGSELRLVRGERDHVLVPLPPDGTAHSVLEDSAGRLWLAPVGERICRGSAALARQGRDPKWVCQDLPGIVHATDIIETPRGTIWLGTRHGGLLYFDGGGWSPVPSAASLKGRMIASLAHSPRGGIWIANVAGVVRVVEGDRPDAPWTVVERLGSWNGLITGGAGQVLEDADGTVWLTTSVGLTRVPVQARSQARVPPPVALAEVRVKGVPRDGPVRMPYADNSIELEFVGPSFREPKLVAYRLRMGPGRNWSAPTSQSTFTFVDLPPGHYAVEVAASLDGEHWSEPARYEFDVARPWWLEPWAWVAGGLGALAIGFGIHRARLLVALRLERQRIRIAMDLHDEMGSGLGSIGLLAEVAADGDGKTSSLAAQIADTASELGGSLTDIVWSLRSESGDVESLASHLTNKGEALFPGDAPRFETAFPPTWPRVELSLPVRRNVQLICAEALHNAAKHARATRVQLGVDTAGRRWCLWVEDDGVGIDAGAAPRSGGGVGFTSMQSRAEQIGAELDIGPAHDAPRGTRVSLRFAPRARDQRIQ